MAKAKKPGRRRAEERTPPASLVAASVLTAETTQYGTGGRVASDELVRRAYVGTLYSAVMLNATACACQRLRLYRPANGGGLGKLWNGRRVRGKRLSWLHGDGKRQPGHKALVMASTAGDVEEVTEHPFLDLMNRPNPFMTGQQYRQLRFFFVWAAGCSFTLMGEDGKAGGPADIYLLGPQYCTPVGDKRLFIREYVYGIETVAEVRYKPEEVIYFRQHIHPSRPLRALSPAHSVVTHSDLEASALNAEIARWQNGGHPSMVISIDNDKAKLTDAQFKQLQQDFKASHGGINKAGRALFLMNATVPQWAAKPHEMNYIPGMERTETCIYRAFGIPEPVWRMNDANLASSDNADPQWMGQTIHPCLIADEESLTEELLSRFPGTDGWWCCYDDPVSEDRKALVDEMGTLADKGIVTFNEVRTSLGIEPGPPELDEHRYMGVPLKDKVPPLTLKPGDDPAGQEEEDADPEAEGTDDSGTDPPAEGGDGDGDAGTKAAVVPDRWSGADGRCGETTPAADPVPDAKVLPAAQLTTKDDRLINDGAVQHFAREIESWYNRALRGAVTADGGVNLEPYEAELRNVIDRGLRELFLAGAHRGLAEIGEPISFDIGRSDAVAYMQARAGELITSVTGTLKDTLVARLANGMADGKPIAVIQEEIRAEGIADYSAERIVRTEASMAFNEGARQAWEAEGVESKDFIVAGGPCEVCAAISAEHSGKPRAVSEPYYKAGESVGSVVFPQDMQGPPWHPNCVLPDTRVQVGGIVAAFRSVYRGKIVEIRTSWGSRLRVTEKHPILTPRGWVRAGELYDGLNVIGTWDDIERMIVGGPNSNHLPPSAEKVFRACLKAGGMSAHTMPVAAVDFHGDGARLNGKVYVVDAAGALGRHNVSSPPQLNDQKAFRPRTTKSKSFPCTCAFDHLLAALGASAAGNVGARDKSLTLLGCGVPHSVELCRAAPPLPEPGGVQFSDNGGSAHAESIGHCLNRLSPSVHLDHVLSVRKFDYTGHVYNFSTLSGLYVADDIITHNCRCSLVPVVKTDGVST